MNPHALINETGKHDSCSHCGLRAICLPPAVSSEDLDTLERLISRSSVLSRGSVLYGPETTNGAIHAVRSGAFKTIRLLPDGSEQVTGFYLPGDVMGIEALGHGGHDTRAIALERSTVCTLPTDKLEELSRQLPSLQRHLFHLMGQEIREDHQLLQLVATQAADTRLASFLMSLSQRQQRRRQDARQLRLPMSRADLASHLGLALETVSRQLGRMQDSGILAVSAKQVEIIDRHRLAVLAGQCAADTSGDAAAQCA